MNSNLLHQNFIERISALLNNARNKIVNTVNQTMVLTYFEIGRMIVEEEQTGKDKADYGKEIIKRLSIKLIADFGKGFSTRNIEQMRSFYIKYAKGQTVSDKFKLSWSHYLNLMRIDDEKERNFYEIELSKNNEQIFASKYSTILPSKEKLKQLIQE
ncbi:MAG: DUF1016 family protein [Pedobacter sp.]|nr:MAG: DUF1016 family protein [Pedobacter sp.]